VGRRVHHGLRALKPLDPLRSEAAMFRVLLYVVALAAVVVVVALVVRALT
jgi:hypothetical protein